MLGNGLWASWGEQVWQDNEDSDMGMRVLDLLVEQ